MNINEIYGMLKYYIDQFGLNLIISKGKNEIEIIEIGEDVTNIIFNEDGSFYRIRKFGVTAFNCNRLIDFLVKNLHVKEWSLEKEKGRLNLIKNDTDPWIMNQRINDLEKELQDLRERVYR